ncbi:MAG: bifunctional precorrin-2 dehydrogenase/sirohydrochlorin ferrochelatase [Candidatus Latescibacterota bacterium]
MINPQFQVGLDVMGRLCVVLGGGAEAEHKVLRLLGAGAVVRLVAPEVTPRLQEEARADRLQHEARAFRPEDLDGAFLVINTVSGQRQEALRVHEEARRRGLLVNTYDTPALSNFGNVALVDAGHLRLAISTSNASPSLAGRLRQELSVLFGTEFVEYLDQLARVRARVRQRVASFRTRAALLRNLVEGFHVEGQVVLPPGWRQQAEALLECDLLECGTRQRCAACPVGPQAGSGGRTPEAEHSGA